MPFSFVPTSIPDLVLVTPRAFPDDRGYFLESYKASDFTKAGITDGFVQDNHSYSRCGVLRGLHYQLPPQEQGKLVRVISGAVWDVAVDLRPNSPSLGRWFGTVLSGENLQMLYVPPGFAHGFLVVSDDAHLLYKCTAEYAKDSERSIRYDDPQLAIEWPSLPAGATISLSDKDAGAPLMRDAEVFG